MISGSDGRACFNHKSVRDIETNIRANTFGYCHTEVIDGPRYSISAKVRGEPCLPDAGALFLLPLLLLLLLLFPFVFFSLLSLLLLLLLLLSPLTPLNPEEYSSSSFSSSSRTLIHLYKNTRESLGNSTSSGETYLWKFSGIRGGRFLEGLCEDVGPTVELQLNQSQISKDGDLNCLNCSFYRARICITRPEEGVATLLRT